MAIVYRMENSKGHGPFSPDAAYAGGKSFEGAYRQVKDMWQHVPWIEVDENGLNSLDTTHPHHLKDVVGTSSEYATFFEMLHLPLLEGTWTVGCDSIQQFEHWFPPQSLADFQRHGMKLDIYDVPDSAILRGDWQVMFDPTKAKLVKSEPLTALLENNAMPQAA